RACDRHRRSPRGDHRGPDAPKPHDRPQGSVRRLARDGRSTARAEPPRRREEEELTMPLPSSTRAPRRLLRRARQRGTSSVVSTLAVVGTTLVVASTLVATIGDSMQSTGIGIGNCMQTHDCKAGEYNPDPGKIADFKPTASESGASTWSNVKDFGKG